MHSAPAGLWEPCPPSKHASPPPPLSFSTSRLAHVTSATPAKRITFYKSGDSQFGGVRMAIHKRSFKCFDALLDDLSQKVPLPFGVRTVTTPRGIHSIKHLEQLQDGGCYLCSDRRQAKPINMELAGKRPAVWHHYGRRPQLPEAPPTYLPHRQRRILLVKNSEPGVRRSVVLRRSARSLRAFLEEISELMQFHIRKLYTVEGRKIDSVQSLMTCPGVLVCVGREPLSPFLVDLLRRSSEEKLPGLGSRSPGLGPRTPGNGARSPVTQGARSPPHGARSRASEYSEGHENKKNVNFGLETKKSIIHPRSDSSNRSSHFSLSSEKSYPNGLSTCPHSQVRPAIMNDDIEKRVLVNKDGSLSVEMRVRFRLRNDETLQWSTEIKKSPPGSLTNDCCPLKETQPHYLQQSQSETCSDPDSASCDPEARDYINQTLQRPLEESQYPCCNQRQEQHYDLWENTSHSHNHRAAPSPHSSRHTHMRVRQTHSSSSSSSCHSQRVVHRRVGSRRGASSEQGPVVQKEMCVTEQVQRRLEVKQDGDTRVEVCTISRCCSCSGVTATNSNLHPQSSRSADDDKSEEGATKYNGELMSEGEERPLSGVSNSSHVLQALQEDHDAHLTPSTSCCCHSNDPPPSQSPQTRLTPRPPSHTNSRHSAKHRTHSQTASASPVPMPQGEEGGEKGCRAVSVASSCHCGVATPSSTAGGEEQDRATSSRSKTSRACSRRSIKTRTPNPEEDWAADDEDEEGEKRAVSGLSTHTGLSVGSGRLGGSTVCPHCGGCKRVSTPGSAASATPDHRAEESISRASQRSHHSQHEATLQAATPKPATPLSNTNNADDCVEVERADSSMSDGLDGSGISTRSNKSNCTNRGCSSVMSNILEGQADIAISLASNRSKCSHSPTPPTEPRTEPTKEEEERAPSAISAISQRSTRSHKSSFNGSTRASSPKAGAEIKEGRTTSAMSAKSNQSAKSIRSQKFTSALERAASPSSEIADQLEEKAASALSVKSARSNTSSEFHKSNCSGTANASATETTGRGAEEAISTFNNLERAASAMSAKSNNSAKTSASANSHRSNCNARDASPVNNTAKIETDMDERAPSNLSAKSNTSSKPAKSHVSKCSTCARAVSPKSTASDALAKDTAVAGEEGQEEEERTGSVLSTKLAQSNVSAKSSKSHNSSQGAREVSPSCDASDVPVTDIPGRAKGEEEEEEKMEETAASAMLANLSDKSSNSHKSTKARSLSPRSELAENTGERAASAMSAHSVKSNVSAKSAKSCISKCNCGTISMSPSSNLNQEGEEMEKGELGEKSKERAASAMSAKSAKSSVSATSTKSHESSCNGNARVVSPNFKTGGDEDVEVVGDKAEGGADNEERAASAISTKSRQSVRSNKSYNSDCNCSARAESPTSKTQDNEEVEGEKEDEADENEGRAASALSAKSARSNFSTKTGTSAKSGKSHKSNCDTSSRAASPNKDAPEMEDITAERAPSTLSAKSNVSAKSTKTHKSNSTGEAPRQSPDGADIPTIETNEGQELNEGQLVEGGPSEQRAPSSLSAKSTKSNISAKSSKSHKSTCKRTDIQTIETNGADERQEDVGETAEERTGSAISVTSESTMKSSRSQKSTCNESVRAVSPSPNTAHIVTIEMPEGVDPEGEDGEKTEKSHKYCSGRSKSSLSASVKSTGSKCRCGAPSSPQKVNKEEEEKEASERAPSVLSSTSKQSGRESACHTSTASVSLCLSEDQEQEPADSDSSKSCVSTHNHPSAHSESKSRAKMETPNAPTDDSAAGETGEAEKVRTASAISAEAKGSVKSTISPESDGSNGSAKPTDIPTIEKTAGDGKDEEEKEETKEKEANVLSAKRDVCVKCSRSLKSPSNGSEKATSPKPPNGPKEQDMKGSKAGNYLKTATTKGCSTTDNRASSAMSSSSTKLCSKSPMKAGSKPTNSANPLPEDSAAEKLETQATSRPASQAKAKDDITPEKVLNVHCKSPNSLRPESAASARSRSKLKASKEGEGEDKSNGTSQHMEVKGNDVKSGATSKNGSVQSVRTAKSEKKATPKESSRPNSVVLSQPPISSPLNNSKPAIVVETSSESALSHSLSAADLLRETMAAAPPPSCQSKASSINDKAKSETSRRSHRSRKQNDGEVELEMSPASLPNASPDEVVSDWLRSIPANGCIYTLGDVLNEGAEETKEGEEEPGEEVMKEDKHFEDEKMREEEVAEKAEPEEKGEEAEDDGMEGEEEADAAPPSAEITSCRPAPVILSSDSLPWNCHSSVAVMKVLLSPGLERCHSLPELSPVYGRRLSTSAKGLLDCLAQLQLVDPTPNPGCDKHKERSQRYNEMMAILQSLWLTGPKDKESKDQVTPPRSSSGVDVTSGSDGSGKDNDNGGDETSAKAGADEVASIHGGEAVDGDGGWGETGQEAAGEGEAGEEAAGEEETGEEEAGEEEAGKEVKLNTLPEPSSDRAKTDVTVQEPSIPAEEDIRDEEQQVLSPSPPVDGEVIPCPDSPKATETPCSSDKSSANDASKSPTDTERETPEDSSSGSPPTVLQALLTKRMSQDPDPVWVLNLLKKLEKQFMSHYIDAMAEFKVRWDLDDSVVLDTMITELRDEVCRRIQSSVDREVRKIQDRTGRVGRSPRPPVGGNLSRESTMTEKRRRMLKVMKNQSAKTADSFNDGELTPEFSDQRSDDEYCPCDACVRKKMAARPIKMHLALAAAPVMIEFDLRKILQLKKDPEPELVEPPPEPMEENEDMDEEVRNLEVVQEEEEEEEEEEETKDNVIPTVVVEETITEEEQKGDTEAEEGEGEMTGEEKEEGEEGEEDEGEKAETAEELVAEQGSKGEAGNEMEAENREEEKAGEMEEEVESEVTVGAEEEVGGTIEEEEGETTDNREEKEGEKTEEGQTTEEGGETAEDDGGETGEDETVDDQVKTGTGEEEESDKETLKGETGDEGGTTENGEEGGMTERENGGETEEGEGETEGGGGTEDDSALEDKSSPVEEYVAGDIGGSREAEDEDDGEDDDSVGEGDTDEGNKGEETEAQEEEAASLQDPEVTPVVCVTEGEEADAEDSDVDGKRPGDTGADESGREGGGTTGDDEEEKEGGGTGEDGDMVEDIVEEFKPEEEEEEEGDGENSEGKGKGAEDNVLLQQHTRTSVESQPGSLEAIDTEATATASPLHPVSPVQAREAGTKMVTGMSTGEGAAGRGQRRSRSPARTKRRKPKESDVELDDVEI